MLAAGSRHASLRRLGLLSHWLAVWVVHASCHSPGRALQFGRLSRKVSNGINATAAGFAARCLDLKIECPGWAAAGLCKNDSTYMNATCQRSCGLCASEPREPVVQHWVQPRRGCLDREGYDCQTRAERGECLASANATAMKCPASCKLCHFNSILREAITCEDENLNCARWASEGECTTNPSYMESSCAASCGMCTNKDHLCDRPADTPPAVVAGTIDETMRRILSNFPQYSPIALSRPSEDNPQAPWVVTLDNFLNDSEAAAFVSTCESHFDRSLAGDTLSPVRTSYQCWCSQNECERHPLTQGVAARISDVVRAPVRYFEPFREAAMSRPRKNAFSHITYAMSQVEICVRRV